MKKMYFSNYLVELHKFIHVFSKSCEYGRVLYYIQIKLVYSSTCRRK